LHVRAIREARFDARASERDWASEARQKLTRLSATLDHIQPVSKGGDHSFANLVISCLPRNSRRGNSPIMDSFGTDRNTQFGT